MSQKISEIANPGLLVMGVISFLRIASFNIDENPSMRIVKRYGASGSPCLSPLSDRKSPLGVPFKRIEKAGVLTHSAIQASHKSLNPISFITKTIKSLLNALVSEAEINFDAHTSSSLLQIKVRPSFVGFKFIFSL
jgi:hypothetical protein